LNWLWSRFSELGVDNLYDALALRCRVFVLEQGPYLDPDGIDRQAWHLLGRDGQGTLHAYLRIVDPGVKFAEPSMGRVVTSPEARGTGLGRALVSEGLARELVRRIQTMRKDTGLDIAERITTYYQAGETWEAVLQAWGEYIQGETLSTTLLSAPAPEGAFTAEFEIEGQVITIGIHPT